WLALTSSSLLLLAGCMAGSDQRCVAPRRRHRGNPSLSSSDRCSRKTRSWPQLRARRRVAALFFEPLSTEFRDLWFPSLRSTHEGGSLLSGSQIVSCVRRRNRLDQFHGVIAGIQDDYSAVRPAPEACFIGSHQAYFAETSQDGGVHYATMVGQRIVGGRKVWLAPPEAVQIVHPSAPPSVIQFLHVEGLLTRSCNGKHFGAIALPIVEHLFHPFLPLGRIVIGALPNLERLDQVKVAFAQLWRGMVRILVFPV